jgi:hypothetical protein
MQAARERRAEAIMEAVDDGWRLHDVSHTRSARPSST